MEEFFDESDITRAIVEETAKELVNFSEVDVVIVGAGSSGLTAAFYLAKKGKKNASFRKKTISRWRDRRWWNAIS